MTGRGDGSDESAGAWRLPGWLQRLPQLGWVFLALAFLDALAAVQQILADQQVDGSPTSWVAVLVRLIEVAGPVAIVLLPVASLARRPSIWRESEPLFLGAVLLAIGELLPVVPRFIPIATPSLDGVQPGQIVLGSPLEIVAPISFTIGIALIAFGLPLHPEAPVPVLVRARTVAGVGLAAALARVATVLGYVALLSALVITPVSAIVNLVTSPLNAVFVAVLALRAIGTMEDGRRDARERRVTAAAAVLWISSTVVGAAVALVNVIVKQQQTDALLVAIAIAGLLSASAAIAMLAAYALGMSEARIRVAAGAPPVIAAA